MTAEIQNNISEESFRNIRTNLLASTRVGSVCHAHNAYEDMIHQRPIQRAPLSIRYINLRQNDM